MPTSRQERLAEAIIKNATATNPKNKGELAVSSGYAPSTAEGGVKDIIEQKGVQIALQERGFTEENAKRVVGEILLDRRTKPDTRINAAKEIFKVHGSYAPDKSINVNVNQEIIDPEAEKLRLEFEEKMRKKYSE